MPIRRSLCAGPFEAGPINGGWPPPEAGARRFGAKDRGAQVSKRRLQPTPNWAQIGRSLGVPGLGGALLSAGGARRDAPEESPKGAWRAAPHQARPRKHGTGPAMPCPCNQSENREGKVQPGEDQQHHAEHDAYRGVQAHEFPRGAGDPLDLHRYVDGAALEQNLSAQGSKSRLIQREFDAGHK